MKKSAFTMIELVFVIIILGILASIAMDSTDRDLTQEASSTVLSNIRLAQQKALSDNKHKANNDPNWQRAYWRFEFNSTSPINYTIGSDIDLNGIIEKTESAIDPTDGKYLFNNSSGDNTMSEKVLLEKKFGVNSITPSAGCSGSNSIAFDYLGRPHINTENASNNFATIMSNDCNITFGMSASNNFTITIEAETGHTFIVGEPNS